MTFLMLISIDAEEIRRNTLSKTPIKNPYGAIFFTIGVSIEMLKEIRRNTLSIRRNTQAKTPQANKPYGIRERLWSPKSLPELKIRCVWECRSHLGEYTAKPHHRCQFSVSAKQNSTDLRSQQPQRGDICVENLDPQNQVL